MKNSRKSNLKIKFRDRLIFTGLLFAPFLATADTVSLKNPTKFTTLEGLLSGIIAVIMIIAIPIIIFFFIYSGFSYLTANGNPEELKKATRMFTYTVIGAVLILGAYAIRDIIANLVTAFTN